MMTNWHHGINWLESHHHRLVEQVTGVEYKSLGAFREADNVQWLQ